MFFKMALFIKNPYNALSLHKDIINLIILNKTIFQVWVFVFMEHTSQHTNRALRIIFLLYIYNA
jgi:hypothetical protein